MVCETSKDINTAALSCCCFVILQCRKHHQNKLVLCCLTFNICRNSEQKRMFFYLYSRSESVGSSQDNMLVATTTELEQLLAKVSLITYLTINSREIDLLQYVFQKILEVELWLMLLITPCLFTKFLVPFAMEITCFSFSRHSRFFSAHSYQWQNGRVYKYTRSFVT